MIDDLQPSHCKVKEPLEILLGKWTPVILLNLMHTSPMRFSEVKRAIPDITQKMLTKQLRELESQEIITREVYPEVPPRVEYAITPYGRTLEPILDALHKWGIEHKKRLQSSH
ncbi:winged helix-turn-helix transcriptional regulator [Marinilactibacillus kalidii]|uniref:winged helix-turn-helix transcriptional regulator n=1 Tax=Marinilactibacillus kalidii TaxID=2820274 RepID=UPI001ABE2DF0|nr:helix-turn-helix domain-containing protein [Marinilactibacillus kalidii]